VKKCLCSLIVTAFVVALAPGAEAACITPDRSASAIKRILPPPSLARAGNAGPVAESSGSSIVGFWQTTFYVGDTTNVWDQAFELWHADGTELAVDNAVPPVLGNVCIGVWQQLGRTIKLRHYTWNWNPDGTKAGVFQLEMTVTVGRGGDTFEGTYVSDSFDLDGKVIPELHGEGVVRASRITAD
jgi:hypothetical protein